MKKKQQVLKYDYLLFNYEMQWIRTILAFTNKLHLCRKRLHWSSVNVQSPHVNSAVAEIISHATELSSDWSEMLSDKSFVEWKYNMLYSIEQNLRSGHPTKPSTTTCIHDKFSYRSGLSCRQKHFNPRLQHNEAPWVSENARHQIIVKGMSLREVERHFTFRHTYHVSSHGSTSHAG